MRLSCVSGTDKPGVEIRMQIQNCYFQGFKISIETEIKNGRATVELFLPPLSDINADGYQIYLWDAGGEPVFYAHHPAGEEDPCILQLQHPHLWETGSDPYLYRLEIYGADRQPSVCVPFPVRELTFMSGKGSLLNGRPFTPKAVYYENMRDLIYMEGVPFDEQIRSRLTKLTGMGANTLLIGDSAGISREEYQTLQTCCDSLGLLLQADNGCPDDDVLANRVLGKALFLSNGCPSAAYYLQRARWCTRSFVYIHAGSLQRQSDGLYRITVYSNQQRVALFVNGVVFGFQNDGPEFVFQDIPAKRFPLLLSAEAGGCNMSVTCYR